MPKWFRANRDVAMKIFDGMNSDNSENTYHLYTLGEEGKAYIVAWNRNTHDVLISDCQNYEDHNTKYSETAAKKTCKIKDIKNKPQLVTALNNAYEGKKYYNTDKRRHLLASELIANANADNNDSYGIGLFDSSANSSSSDSGQGSWGTSGWSQQPPQYQQPPYQQQQQYQQPQYNTYQTSSPTSQSNPYQTPQYQQPSYQQQQQYQQQQYITYQTSSPKSQSNPYQTPQYQQPSYQQQQQYQQQQYTTYQTSSPTSQSNPYQPPANQKPPYQPQQKQFNPTQLDKKHKERSKDNDDLNAKMDNIPAKTIDENDSNSNKKTTSEGSASKYCYAMERLAKNINEIDLTTNENIAETIYGCLAQYLDESEWNIKGFNPMSALIDGKFMDCSMRKNPSKLTIAAFKAKHLELSDTKRYTQELLGIIAKYTNLIERINSGNGEEELDTTKFKRNLKAADDYASKFVSSIVKIKNRKGHRAAITFPTALKAVKTVLIKLNEKCSELISELTTESTKE